MPTGNAATYAPRTRVELRLTQQKYRDIANLTGIPLSKVTKYGDEIMKRSMFDTINDIERNINKYVPKATGQLQDSLTHQLHNSTISNSWLQMKLGTYIGYMKHVANMPARNLRHPRGPAFIPRKRNTKWGKKGSPKRNPDNWRWVRYYGGPRWVRLNDPQAQTNFFSQLVLYMKTQLQKHIATEIQSTIPAGKRKPFTDKMKVKRP